MSSQRQRKAERRRVRSILKENRMLREFEELVYSKPPIWKIREWFKWRKEIWG